MKNNNIEEKIVRQFLKSKHKKVICIDAGRIPRESHAPSGQMQKGKIYHVMAIRNGGFEILGKPIFFDSGPGTWRPDRFRFIA